jgi:hypothetical protein
VDRPSGKEANMLTKLGLVALAATLTAAYSAPALAYGGHGGGGFHGGGIHYGGGFRGGYHGPRFGGYGYGYAPPVYGYAPPAYGYAAPAYGYAPGFRYAGPRFAGNYGWHRR